MKGKTNQLFLIRDRRCEDDGTLGHILVPERRPATGDYIFRKFATIERRWLNNAPNVSCIPDGEYPLVARTWGGFFRKYKKEFGHEFVAEVADVPGRSSILIHRGNTESDVTGCIAVGYPRPLANVKCNSISDSTQALKTIYDLLAAGYEREGKLFLRVRTAGEIPCAVE